MTANQAFVLSKKYTDDSVAGAGAIKGAPCEIQSIEDGIVTFLWEDTNGNKHTLGLDVGKAIAEKLSFALLDGDLTVTTED